MIGHTLGEKPEKYLMEIMQGMGKFTKNNCKRAVSDLIKKYLNENDWHEAQVNYFKETLKQKDWKFWDWLQRIKTIKKYLDNMDTNLPKLMECQINKDVIQLNLPLYLQTKFIEEGGYQKQTLAEVVTIMKDLEKADAMHFE